VQPEQAFLPTDVMRDPIADMFAAQPPLNRVPGPPKMPPPDVPPMPPIMCFVAGTKIDMADGTKKVIENIMVGDEVMALNNTTDKVSYVHDIPEDNRQLWTINNRITATDAHAFLTEDGWKSNNPDSSNLVYGDYNIKVTKLTKGDKLITNEGVEEVTDLKNEEAFTKVYNFSTDTTHTYMVDGVVSHNKMPPRPPLIGREEPPMDFPQPTREPNDFKVGTLGGAGYGRFPLGTAGPEFIYDDDGNPIMEPKFGRGLRDNFMSIGGPGGGMEGPITNDSDRFNIDLTGLNQPSPGLMPTKPDMLPNLATGVMEPVGQPMPQLPQGPQPIPQVPSPIMPPMREVPPEDFGFGPGIRRSEDFFIEEDLVMPTMAPPKPLGEDVPPMPIENMIMSNDPAINPMPAKMPMLPEPMPMRMPEPMPIRPRMPMPGPIATPMPMAPTNLQLPQIETQLHRS
jgi:hypothetical protein